MIIICVIIIHVRVVWVKSVVIMVFVVCYQCRISCVNVYLT